MAVDGAAVSWFEFDDITPPYDFAPALTEYVIYPWIQEGDTLVRVLRVASGAVVKAAIRSTGTERRPRLHVALRAGVPLAERDVDEVRATLRRCLLLDADPRPLYALARRDPVLRAAVGKPRGGRGKLYPSVFEALVGVICAQNTLFKRVYDVMERLTAAFGAPLDLDGRRYHAFPTPADLAAAPEEAIRACKVGYRAKYIGAVARHIIERGLDLEALRGLPAEEARGLLLTLPGVGPYAADLVLSVGLGHAAIHVDSYVRAIVSTFYFGGEPVSDERITDFAHARWGRLASAAIGALTTNTHVWARELGVDFPLKSGAVR
jgi:3-methyladenine DNA glycosylase/8-oxoguanine DNA glycosylase